MITTRRVRVMTVVDASMSGGNGEEEMKPVGCSSSPSIFFMITTRRVRVMTVDASHVR